MKHLRYIVSFVLCTLSLCTWSQDFARMGERSIMGTARYVGMSGAMSAIGADPSATLDNVAGLGMYRRAEILVSFDYMADRAWQVGAPDTKGRARLFMAPQAALVLSFPTNKVSGIQYHNVQISYQRIHAYNRALRGTAENSPSLGALFATTAANLGGPYCQDRLNASERMDLFESGYVNEYAFDWAMNISNRWYVGAGLRINSFSMSSEGKYQEWFNHYNTKGDMFYNYSQTRVLFNGVGASLAVGAIYRPAQWFRLGFGLETPSVSTFRTSTSGYFEAQADSVAPGSSSTNWPSEFSGFHMPLHLSTSAAFQITNYALLAFQYDYFHQPGEINRHSLRAGVEVVPYPGVYLNAGYAYESPFRKSYPLKEMDMSLERQDTYSLRTHRTQYISGAVGYRGRYLLVQAAYQYRMQRVKIWAHEAVNDPYDINADTHRVVVTIGWHR